MGSPQDSRGETGIPRIYPWEGVDVPEVGCARIAAPFTPQGPALLTNPPRVVLTSEVRRLLTNLLTNARARGDLGGIWRHSMRSKTVGPVGLEPTT